MDMPEDAKGAEAVKTEVDSRACDGGSPGPAELVELVENDARLRRGDWTFRDLINAVPGLRVLILIEAIKGLGAMVQCWNAKKQGYEEKPDYATRQKFAAQLLSYGDGLPIQTNVNLNANARRGAPQAEELTPAMIEWMEREIAKAKGKGKGPALPV